MEEEKCPECNEPMIEEHYITVWESRGEFWGAPCSEEIVTGYKCPFCGELTDF